MDLTLNNLDYKNLTLYLKLRIKVNTANQLAEALK